MPQTPAQIRGSFRTILARIRTQVVEWCGIPEERVLVAARGKVPWFQADQDIVLRPRGFRVDKSWTDQAGRHATVLHRKLEVRIRTRLQTDEPNSDSLWLLDEANGHVALEELVIDALQEFLPIDDPETTKNALTLNPILLLDGDDPDREAGKPTDWGESRLTFEVSYILSLTGAE